MYEVWTYYMGNVVERIATINLFTCIDMANTVTAIADGMAIGRCVVVNASVGV